MKSESYQDRWKWILQASRSFLHPPGARKTARGCALETFFSFVVFWFLAITWHHEGVLTRSQGRMTPTSLPDPSNQLINHGFYLKCNSRFLSLFISLKGLTLAGGPRQNLLTHCVHCGTPPADRADMQASTTTPQPQRPHARPVPAIPSQDRLTASWGGGGASQSWPPRPPV